MNHCLTVVVRHRRNAPIHFCFDAPEQAVSVMERFARDIDRASNDELVFVNESAGFLKRDFISIEKHDTEDDEGDEAPDEPPLGRAAVPADGAAAVDVALNLCRFHARERAFVHNQPCSGERIVQA